MTEHRNLFTNLLISIVLQEANELIERSVIFWCHIADKKSIKIHEPKTVKTDSCHNRGRKGREGRPPLHQLVNSTATEVSPSEPPRLYPSLLINSWHDKLILAMVISPSPFQRGFSHRITNSPVNNLYPCMLTFTSHTSYISRFSITE